MANPAQQNRFKVVLDSFPIGSWTKCDGLKASYEVQEYKEGGQNTFVHQIPGRLKYENITLTRPVSEESKALAAWFASYRTVVRRATGVISAMAADGNVIMSWAFAGMFPVSWSAGGLDAAGNGVLTEQLVLSHEGFLDAGAAANLGSIG